ncbi:MAG: gliding motility-associated C-terminal domain-containing protein, partial [Saprospiraceae bacterium]|nr:gliding motility-associated C-terminal domain-containing protein [Saprospiraceae bacterium]
CPGDHNGTATVQVSPGSGSPVFSWNSVPPQSAATAVNLPGGIYTVTVTGVGLCPATAAVTVAEPGPLQYQTTTTPAYCGFSVGTANIVTTGGTAPYNYVWLPAVSTSNSAENLPPGNYAVWIKDNNGCRDSLYLQIAPATIQVQVLDNQPVSCPGAEDGKLEVRPNGGAAPFSFSWSTLAGNGPFAANLPSGNYTVTISDTNGCTASLSAAVGQPEPLAFEVQASDLQCPGDQNGAIRIENASGGTPPFRFALNQGALGAASTFTGLAASAYFVRMEDAKGCGLADTVNLIEPSPLQVFAGADTAVFQGNPIRLAGFVSDPIRVGQYSWLPAADLDCPDCPETLALPVRSTQFIFAVTDSNGCVFSDSLLVVVHPGNVYLPNAIRPESVQFNERFTVFAGGNVDQVVSLQVFDRWGNLFFERQNFPASVPSEGWDGHAPDGTPAPAGVYVFVARLRYIDGAEQVFSGSVLVLR